MSHEKNATFQRRYFQCALKMLHKMFQFSMHCKNPVSRALLLLTDLPNHK